MSSRDTKNTNAANERIAKQNNETALQIARENNQLQLDTLHSNQTWQEMMWDKEKEYDSVGSQMARAQAAGLSPYAILDGGAGTAQSSVPSASSAGISPSMPTLQNPSLVSPAAEKLGMFNYISQTLKNIADIGYEGIDQYNNAQQINASVNRMMAETKLQNAQTVHQLLDNDVYSQYGGLQAEANVNKVQAEIVESNANADLDRAKKAEADANTTYIGKKSQTEDELRAPLVAEANENVNLVKEKIKTEGTVQQANKASARASDASAKLSKSQASYYRKMEERLSQPIDGLTLTDEEKDDVKDMLLNMKSMDEQQREAEFNRFMEEHKWDNQEGNVLLRWLKRSVGNMPVVGNVGDLLKGLGK